MGELALVGTLGSKRCQNLAVVMGVWMPEAVLEDASAKSGHRCYLMCEQGEDDVLERDSCEDAWLQYMVRNPGPN
ncbi:hypothetical protein DAI22_11g203020 [Oryza sativa Japonica Group]|nr:hypothetical protein DAI22_11g203020 [Oryza sativa Japonica Group]